MQGMNLASLRHHVALQVPAALSYLLRKSTIFFQPLAIIMAGGMLFVAVYCGRLASKTTDINWTKAKDLGDHMGYYKDRSRKKSNMLNTRLKDSLFSLYFISKK